MVEQRKCVVPDFGDDFVAVAEDLAQALHALAGPLPLDAAESRDLAPVLAEGFGIEAFDRIWPVIEPTQKLAGPRLLSTDGRPLGRVSIVGIDAEDLLAVGDAIREIGLGLLRGDPRITDLLLAFADTAPPQSASGSTPNDIVAAITGWHGLLDLEWTPDADQLEQHTGSANNDNEVRLDEATEAAYVRLTSRCDAMWRAARDWPSIDIESVGHDTDG